MTIKTWEDRYRESCSRIEKELDFHDRQYATKRAMQAEIAELRAALVSMTADRDEWKEATISANGRFRQAEAKLDKLKNQEPVLEVSPYDVNTFYWINNDSVDKAHCGAKLYLAAGTSK